MTALASVKLQCSRQQSVQRVQRVHFKRIFERKHEINLPGHPYAIFSLDSSSNESKNLNVNIAFSYAKLSSDVILVERCVALEVAFSLKQDVPTQAAGGKRHS